jgi:hypothetical protein
MPRERSPNYPGFPLEDAVKNTQQMFKVASRSAVAPVVAVKAWGYTSLNGLSRVRLAALRAYGLIEVEKGGNVKLSRRGLTLSLRSHDSPEYTAAIKEAALTPPIFQDLYETKNGVADEALQHHLVVDRKFSLDGAKRVIEIYRANCEFASLDGVGYTDDIEEEFDVPNTSHPATPTATPAAPAASPVTANVPGVKQYSWPLSSEVTAEVIFRGDKVTRRELRLLGEYLKLAEKALQDEPTSRVRDEDRDTEQREEQEPLFE